MTADGKNTAAIILAIAVLVAGFVLAISVPVTMHFDKHTSEVEKSRQIIALACSHSSQPGKCLVLARRFLP